MKSISTIVVILALTGMAGATAYYVSKHMQKQKKPVRAVMATLQPAEIKEKSIGLASCSALREEKAYGDKFEDFSFMVQGKDGWIFRTKQDTRAEFNIDKASKALWIKFSELLKA